MGLVVTTKRDLRFIDDPINNPDNTLVIVGSALNGPSRIPFQLSTTKTAGEVLGDCPLTDAYNTAVASGAPSIILYRINGEHAELTIKCVTELGSKDVLLLRTVSAADEYNSISATTFKTHIFFPATSYRSERSYFFEDYQTIQELVYEINKDAHFGVIEFTAEILDPLFDLAEFSGAMDNTMSQFNGGATDENFILNRSIENNPLIPVVTQRTKSELKRALFGEDPQDQISHIPNSMLGVLDFGIIVLADMLYEDDQELAKLLGSFCMNKQTETGNGCLGVIGTTPLLTQSEKDKAQNLISLRPVENEEWQKYVQIVTGDSYTFGTAKLLPSAYAYAGSQANYPYYIMMSNKSLEGIRKLEYEFSKEDVDSLSSNGYTCIVASIRKGFVPYVAVSHSKDFTSLLSKPHCVRITNYVSRMLTNSLDSYIGTRNNPITRQEVMDRVHEILGGLVNNKVIMEYRANGRFLNRNTNIDLQVDIRPFSEVRSVSSIVTLSVPGGVIR